MNLGILWLFHRSDFRCLKGNEIFAKENNSFLERAVFRSISGEETNTTVLKLAVDSVNLGLCDSRDKLVSDCSGI